MDTQFDQMKKRRLDPKRIDISPHACYAFLEVKDHLLGLGDEKSGELAVLLTEVFKANRINRGEDEP